MRPSDSTGSGVAPRGVCSRARVAVLMLRLPPRHPEMQTSAARHPPTQRVRRSYRTSYSPCAQLQLSQKVIGIATQITSRKTQWVYHNPSPPPPKCPVMKQGRHFLPVHKSSTQDVVVVKIARGASPNPTRRHDAVRMHIHNNKKNEI